ncbi:hypothetical protein D3C78_310090 [compost metagenome]
MLPHKDIGNIGIFRPSKTCEEISYNRIRTAVFRKYSSGLYTEKNKIVEIVNYKYKLYYQILDEYLPKINAGNFFTFLCGEYELYGQVEDQFKNGRLSKSEEEFWQTSAHNARRGIKHLMELLCLGGMESKADVAMSQQEDAISMVFIAAEELVGLYMRSDYYTHIMKETTLRLDSSKHTYFDITQDQEGKFDIRESMSITRELIPDPNFLLDIDRHDKFLKESFTKKLGVSYKDATQALSWIIDNYSDTDDPKQIGYCLRSEVISTLAHSFKIPPKTAETIIDGFSLSADSMRTEGRELFRPKQQYRAYKRGFFKVSHDNNEFLIFSARMAKECLGLLCVDIVFKKLPAEWKCSTIDLALSKLAKSAGNWFEDVVKSNLKKLDIEGITSVKKIILKNGKRIVIPADVGEIDFLGFCRSQMILVVCEAKQVGFSTEPRMFLDDQSKFITDSKSHSKKFEKKVQWSIENREILSTYLSEHFKVELKPCSMGYAMITHFPMKIASQIEQFTCLSLAEFVQLHRANNLIWSFSRIEYKDLSSMEAPLKV